MKYEDLDFKIPTQLEYLDADDEPWIDVHPLVVETEEFQSAYAEQSTLIRP